jgi:hypothetical protein
MPIVYLRADPEAALVRAIIAHSCGFTYRLRQVAEVNPAFFAVWAAALLVFFCCFVV